MEQKKLPEPAKTKLTAEFLRQVPEIVSQQAQIEDDEQQDPQTPEEALAESVDGEEHPAGWPFPTSAHDDKPEVPVTTKRRRKVAEKAPAGGVH